MADTRSRGGKKQGNDNPQNPEQHQGVTATTSQPEKDRDNHDQDRPRPGDGGQDERGGGSR